MNAEEERVAQNDRHGEGWELWGPYLSERAWATVREDYSANGDVWSYFPHEHARSRAYRWSEDGIAGISDFKQMLCLAFAFWNGHDPTLKERLFGVTGPQGNHGEDVKEFIRTPTARLAPPSGGSFFVSRKSLSHTRSSLNKARRVRRAKASLSFGTRLRWIMGFSISKSDTQNIRWMTC